jgi:Ser/Thr protein kinase RdoA (MazF antagonist)
MKPFEELTERGQVRRLRRLAQAALQEYGLGDAQLTFVAYSENAVFRVESPRGRYALRVHRPGYQTEASLDSELAWMAALRQDAGLPVPEPRPSLDGRLRVQASVPGIPGPRNVSLLTWIKGRRIASGLRPAHFWALGQLVARMHEHAAHWQPPAWFTRRHWDWEGLFGDQAGFDLHAREVWALVPDQHRASFEAVARETRQVMDKRGKAPDAFGLIHADLSIGGEGNVLFHRGQARPLDFDDCGYGYWVYDWATALAHWQTHPQWSVYRGALLDGYAGVRPLPKEQLAHLGLFMAARHVSEMLWAIDLAQTNPGFRQGLDEWMKWAALHIQHYQTGQTLTDVEWKGQETVRRVEPERENRCR